MRIRGLQIREQPFLYKLRWVFDYFDDKPSVRSVWDDRTEGKAAFTDKTNLRRAAIEVIDNMARVRVVAECDGHDFINFEWMVYEKMQWPERLKVTNLRGLRLKTRDMIAEVYKNGEITSRPRPAYDHYYHYAGFGR